MLQNNVVGGSLRHYISQVLQSPLPCTKEVRRLETSHRPLISHLLPRDSSLYDGEGGHHIPIPGTAVWPFSSTLGIHQGYEGDQNAGTRDGHQSLSVPGRLAHLFTISRPVFPRHCTSAQSLPHDGPPHSGQEFGTDPKTEIPFSGIPVRPGFLPGHSNSGSISQNQSTDLRIPAKPRRICSYVADPARSLCVHRKNGSSGTAAHPRSPTSNNRCQVQNGLYIHLSSEH